MNVWKGDDREPTPEDLAAYLDGEFEGDDALLSKKQAVAAWLTGHPEAAGDLAAWRKLNQIWSETTPAGPDEDRWSQVLAGIQSDLAQPAAPGVRSRRFPWGWVFGAAAALLLVLGALAVQWLANQNQPDNRQSPNLVENPPRPGSSPQSPQLILPDEPLPMAAADDIEILTVAGSDMDNLVVGNLPLQGTMKLAGPGEVVFSPADKAPEANPEPKTSEVPPMVWVGSNKNP